MRWKGWPYYALSVGVLFGAAILLDSYPLIWATIAVGLWGLGVEFGVWRKLGFYGYTVNDNDRRDGTQGSILRHGRWFVSWTSPIKVTRQRETMESHRERMRVRGAWARESGNRMPSWNEGPVPGEPDPVMEDHKHAYHMTVAKGWWNFGPRFAWCEIEFALGGEDGMAQVSLWLPRLVGFGVGVKVPRKLLDGWVYERRVWQISFGFGGSLLLIDFARDDGMADMESYYRAKWDHRSMIRGRLFPTRAMLWPGWRLSVPGWWLWKNRLLGRPVHGEEIVAAYNQVAIPLPEGVYFGRVTFVEDVWKRPRWPRPKVRRFTKIDFDSGPDAEFRPPMFAGKGENSWDCDDDAIYGSSVSGWSVADCVSDYVSSVLKYRERYGPPSEENLRPVIPGSATVRGLQQ